MRVYLPLTLPALREAHRAGELAPGARPPLAYAVTPGLREWYASDDVEELEYAALGSAARASLLLLAAAPDAPRRRVVLAADVADAAVSPAPDQDAPGGVRVAGAVPLSRVAAVHVDADDAERDVAAAAEALADGAGEAAAEGVETHDLLWYATQEIPYLLG